MTLVLIVNLFYGIIPDLKSLTTVKNRTIVEHTNTMLSYVYQRVYRMYNILKMNKSSFDGVD